MQRQDMKLKEKMNKHRKLETAMKESRHSVKFLDR